LSVALAYLVATLIMTWPLAAGVTRDVPGDLGDSLLNMWILGWGAEHVPRVATGQMSLGEFWNANIFHPEPLALSFSEHLFGQVLQILPVYHATHNLILSYNLLFLSSFVLSGLGMYLLARDMLDDVPVGGSAQSGNRSAFFCLAAFVAGLIYAFVPYRVVQLAHIQTVSSQWMPFALYGFRRFLRCRATGPGSAGLNVPALAGGSFALLMQNWSCGYYLIYFAPFVLLFVVHQIVATGRAREWRVWAGFTAAAAVVAAGTWPFLALYLEAQRVHAFERPIGEVIGYSADVYGYLTSSGYLRLWGQVLQVAPKPEGEIFLGFTPMLLGLTAILIPTAAAWRHTENYAPPRSLWRRIAVRVFAVIAVVQGAGFVGVMLTGGFVTSIVGIPVRASNASRLLLQFAVAVLAIAILSPHARMLISKALRSPIFLASGLTLLAAVLSLGPLPTAQGRLIPGLGLYQFLYDNVPGFDGLRVPSRMAMITALFLSLLAAFGAAQLEAHWRSARWVLAIACFFFLVEATAVPLPVNVTWGGIVTPPDRVYPPDGAPAVYHAVRALPANAVVAEFPFGDPAWEMRFVYYSTVHWKRLVNGYSGAFPQGYKLRLAVLQDVTKDPDRAWRTLVDAGTTHVIVHEGAYPPGVADTSKAWLATRGAHEIGRFDRDVLFSLP